MFLVKTIWYLKNEILRSGKDYKIEPDCGPPSSWEVGKTKDKTYLVLNNVSDAAFSGFSFRPLAKNYLVANQL